MWDVQDDDSSVRGAAKAARRSAVDAVAPMSVVTRWGMVDVRRFTDEGEMLRAWANYVTLEADPGVFLQCHVTLTAFMSASP
jgi:hypothetical protein